MFIYLFCKFLLVFLCHFLFISFVKFCWYFLSFLFIHCFKFCWYFVYFYYLFVLVTLVNILCYSVDLLLIDIYFAVILFL